MRSSSELDAAAAGGAWARHIALESGTDPLAVALDVAARDEVVVLGGGGVVLDVIGQVPARGRTLQQLSGQIAQKLQQGYLRDPDVTIDVDRYRSVFIMGEVGQPGQYAYVPGMTVQNAIAVAGGFTSRANQRMVDVTRKINGQVLTGRINISGPIIAGDTIYVRERLF